MGKGPILFFKNRKERVFLLKLKTETKKSAQMQTDVFSFGLKSEVLGICSYFLIFRWLDRMPFPSSWRKHTRKMPFTLHYCCVLTECLSFPSW